MDIVLYALTALLYGGLAVAGWRAHRHTAVEPALAGVPAGVGSMTSTSRASGMSGVGRALLLVALLVHGVLLHTTIFPQNAMIFGFAFALSAMFWLGAGIYWIESFFFPLDGLRLLVLPLACVASLLPLLFGGVRVLSYSAAPMFKLHFLIANIAYGLFAIAALHAVLMLLLERRLQRMRGLNTRHAANGGWLASWLDTLPPLLTLEKLLFRLIAAGFVLLTLTLVSGIAFNEQLVDRALRLDHKTVFAFLSWVMFGALLTARRVSGWRGRAALRWVLASFVALLLAYVGSRFVFEVLLHRAVV
ncbi:cytochrome c biogenesis protein CcsA [Caballeronia sp. LP006]|uniref:cytochrome C assembly family protein n=1 Tax=unclassified Caballeronia TaxID=2646786 RepID=UPI001FD11225|nr:MULTISPECIES: cytochrome c biogenesis protein CcsA [unclassified Caballeronia]MDR5772557.1 cytochrome c biogenesis protein CcsA [Caballeronia sp. LZ002]MDR5804015.1 cytochrome c biogenesis protein CcsA [Caballeronia sp. LZ001]MDR5832151.1 cytochrome c biogenesis protein CcsA [Caballeronia sp. LP006]MDR5847991.1 cytochrome c biogenesis protein CcsA [Caballeronia sp. LZ003]